MHLFKLPSAIFAGILDVVQRGNLHARRGVTPEDRFSPDHISGLPPEVREAVARGLRADGPRRALLRYVL